MTYCEDFLIQRHKKNLTTPSAKDTPNYGVSNAVYEDKYETRWRCVLDVRNIYCEKELYGVKRRMKYCINATQSPYSTRKLQQYTFKKNTTSHISCVVYDVSFKEQYKTILLRAVRGSFLCVGARSSEFLVQRPWN